MTRLALHFLVGVVLTAISQLGGLAWLIGWKFRHRWIAIALCYSALSFTALWVAPLFGREALSCRSHAALQMQSWGYCALNRHYVTPELKATLTDLSKALDQRYPGTTTLVLDAGFPFFEGFPLLPHLSHHDGRKADIALFYKSAGAYLPGQTRSPLGYFAFEQGPTRCPKKWPTLRWDLDPLQPLWRDWQLEPKRTREALLLLSKDPRAAKIFVEPHLQERLGVDGPKLRFQGCRAARHDDHIHLQL